MVLDNRTLALTTVLFGILVTLIIGVFAFSRRGKGGTFLWSLSNGFFTLGFILLALQGVAASFLTVVIGNLVLLAGAICLNLGIRQHLGAPLPYKRHLIFILVTLIALLFYLYFWDQPWIRIIFMSGALAYLCFDIFLIKVRTQPKSVFYSIFRVVMLFEGLFFIFRAIITLFNAPAPDQPNSLMNAGWISSATFLVFTGTMVSWTLLLVLTKFEEASRSKDRLFSIIAHDLRSPIGNMQSILEVLSSQEPSAQTTNTLKELKKTADGTYKLLENLLTWARSQRGEIKLNWMEIHLEPYFQGLKNLFGPQFMSKGIELELHIEPGVKVRSDESALGTIIRNLLSNALKFTAKGKVQLHGLNYKGGVKISVIDTGLGIPVEKITEVLNFSGTSSTRGTMGESGSGLGLVLCREFTELLGGKMTIQSQSGIGTTVELDFKTN